MAGAPDTLPIDAVLPELREVLAREGRAVLQAPPGAGKTTRVPLDLMAHGAVEGRIVMLEPRRVAARAAADRLAASLGEEPGGRVGYRMRGATVKGSHIEVVTQGVLTRMIQNDPELAGIGCVIFDEFHERALTADLGLALVLELRGAFRPDLKFLVMSATLDAEPVAELMDGAPVVTSRGRAWPVETRWMERPWRQAGRGRAGLELAVRDQVLTALGETEGGVLVFLPGQGEIGRAAQALSGVLPKGVELQQLHGSMPLKAQRAALSPLASGRKLVLATSIAETSLTIPDVRVVVDAGFARRSRFDPGSGMSRLVTERVTRAEAEQRRGRAGRVAEGWCYRLWTKGEEGALGAFPPPEIASADLGPLALELAVWGAAPGELAFLTPPPDAAFEEAVALLQQLGALDAERRVTSHGGRLAKMPVHPRLGHMLVRAAEAGNARLGADLAALLEERNPVLDGGQSDLMPGLQAIAGRKGSARVDAGAVARIRQEGKRLRALVPDGDGPGELSPGGALSLAYPDRIGLRRKGDKPRYLLSGGKGAKFRDDDGLAAQTMVVAADTDGDPREATIRRALPVRMAEIREIHAERIERVRLCKWSKRERVVLALERTMLGALVLDENAWRDAPDDAVAAAMVDGVRELGLAALPWNGAARRFVARVNWVNGQGAGLPVFTEEGLDRDLETWLVPYLQGVRRASDLEKVKLLAALEARLDWNARQDLDRLAPPKITAPTGTGLPVDYGDTAPSVSVRLQEMYGVTRHPVVGPDAIPLLVHLLSPGHRPVQTTNDLPGFWQNTYLDVRRDLRGRYPKHFWPDDPATAQPMRGTKKQNS